MLATERACAHNPPMTPVLSTSIDLRHERCGSYVVALAPPRIELTHQVPGGSCFTPFRSRPLKTRTRLSPEPKSYLMVVDHSGRPIFATQSVDAAEFPQVVGDQNGAQCQRVGGDHQIQWANWGALCVQSVPGLGVFLRDG